MRKFRDSIDRPPGDLDPRHRPAPPEGAARAARRRVAIGRFYQGISGFAAAGAGPSGRKLRPARARIYGELTATGARQLLAATRLGPGDVFVDLGSGVGKVVLQVALRVQGVRCIGIEIDGERHASACEALRRVEAAGLLAPGRCVFRHADLRTADLGEATVLFAHATCFPATVLGAVVRQLATGRRPVTFVTTKRLSGLAAKRLTLVATRACHLSWDSHHRMHLYRNVAARQSAA